MPMQGLTVSSLRKNPSLLVIHAATVFGAILAAGFTARITAKCPDVCIDKRDKSPWQSYDRRQYKFVNVNSLKYSDADPEKPDF